MNQLLSTRETYQNVVYSHDGTLFFKKKKRSINTYYNMNESQRCYTN